MTKVLVTEDYLEGIADGIRYANGGSATYKPPQMEDAIRALKKTLVEKSVTANGSYDPASDSADGYSAVTVNVPNSYAAGDEGKVVSNGALVAQTAHAEVTSNGTIDTTLNNSVTVNVSGGGSGEIPAGYTRLAYIESDGNQYIDTGVDPTNGYRTYLRCCYTALNNIYDTILGSQGSSGSTNRAAAVMRGNQSNNYAMWAGTSFDWTVPLVHNTLTGIMVDMRNGKYFFSTDTHAYYNTYSGALTNRTLYLFALNDNGSFGYSAKARLDFAFIMGSDGNFIRKFYAVKRDSDDKPGLWESVNGVFYTNLGTGEFTMPQGVSA